MWGVGEKCAAYMQETRQGGRFVLFGHSTRSFLLGPTLAILPNILCGRPAVTDCDVTSPWRREALGDVGALWQSLERYEKVNKSRTPF